MNNIPRFVYFVWTSPGNRRVSRQFAGRMQKRPGFRPGAPLSKKRGVKMKIEYGSDVGFLFKLRKGGHGPQPK